MNEYYQYVLYCDFSKWMNWKSFPRLNNWHPCLDLFFVFQNTNNNTQVSSIVVVHSFKCNSWMQQYNPTCACVNLLFLFNQPNPSSCSPRRRHCYLPSHSTAASFLPPPVSQFRSILVACGRFRVASSKFTDCFDSLSRKKLEPKINSFLDNSAPKLVASREITGEIERCIPVPCGVRSVIPA